MELNTVRFISCRQTRTCTCCRAAAICLDWFVLYKWWIHCKKWGRRQKSNLSFGSKAGLHVWVSFRLSAPLCICSPVFPSVCPPSICCLCPTFHRLRHLLGFFCYFVWTVMIDFVHKARLFILSIRNHFCPTQLLGEPGKFPKGSLRAPFSHRCTSLHCLRIIFRSAVCRLNCDF